MDFPFVRRFGDVALVALSSAIPTMPFMAAGRLGPAQRAHLALALDELGRRGLFRVVLIHHPPLPGQAGWRRGLRDARALKKVLKEHGAELVLHGHDHAETVHELETATGPAMIVGVPSASEAVAGRIPAARYNEYRIDKVAGGWRCDMVGRAVADTAAHVWECEHRVLLKP
jgi:3',5'-cyclic AMP phosphodiesterase CpdA